MGQQGQVGTAAGARAGGGSSQPVVMGTPSSPPQFQEARQGSLCNQAIMLITDGAVEDYELVLEEYNQPHRKVTPRTVAKGQGPQERCPLPQWGGPEGPGLP